MVVGRLSTSAPNEGLSGKYFVEGHSYPSQAGARRIWEFCNTYDHGQTYNSVGCPHRRLVKVTSFADGIVAPAGAGKDLSDAQLPGAIEARH